MRSVGKPAVDGVPGDFVRLVQDALAHLYDPVHLQGHPLTRLVPAGDQSSSQAGSALRQQLISALEQLRPHRPGPRTAADRLGRGYELLHLRYVEGLDPHDVQQRIGLAKSQYYQDVARAVSAPASLLWDASRQAKEAGEELPAAAGELEAHVTRPWTSFVGREHDLARLRQLLAATTRPGGHGWSL